MMPLQVVYVKENTRAKTKKAVAASFGFGSGTLQGHLLVSTLFFRVPPIFNIETKNDWELWVG